MGDAYCDLDALLDEAYDPIQEEDPRPDARILHQELVDDGTNVKRAKRDGGRHGEEPLWLGGHRTRGLFSLVKVGEYTPRDREVPLPRLGELE